jgi:hypothetical protein
MVPKINVLMHYSPGDGKMVFIALGAGANHAAQLSGRKLMQ